MITEKFYISNSEVNPPQNWQGLEIELNYGKDQFPNSNTVSITDFTWVRAEYDYLQKYIADGLTGGVGIFEAPPFRVDITNGIVTKTVFNGYINLTTGAVFSNKKGNLTGKPDGKITAKATSHATVDWVDQMSGFSFEYLASPEFKATGLPGYISPDMYVFVPYVNSKTPNYEQAAIATLMAFEVGKAIKDAINDLYNLCAEIIENWSDIELTEIIKILIKILYLIALVATIAKLIEDIIKYIISPVKYHAGMRVRDLMAKGVEYMSQGSMTFVSDIWDINSPRYNEVILPEKLYSAPSKSDSSIFGFVIPDKNEQVGYYKGTFKQLLDGMKIKYNAKIVVTTTAGGGTVNFLRKDKNAKPAKYQLPNMYEPEYTYNTDELAGTYQIIYQTDNSDQNTLQNYLGTNYEIVTQPKIVNYRPYVTIEGITVMSIPFAKAVRKTSLTNPEVILNTTISDMNKAIHELAKILHPIIKLYDKLNNHNLSWMPGPLKKVFQKNLGFFNSTPVQVFLSATGTNPVGPLANFLEHSGLQKLISTPAINIGERIGMMLLSDDHFSVPKVLILDESKSGYKYNRINVNSETIESAKAMWDDFHFVNSFIPSTSRPTANQYIKKNLKNVPFDWDDFLKVIDNNQGYDFDNKEMILESLKFNSFKGGGSADMTVRFKQLYTLNLQETFLYPNGA